jgi:hypothetical protein
MMALANKIDYEREYQENQKVIRDRILESMSDIAKGKGRDYEVFFDELENRYKDAKI